MMSFMYKLPVLSQTQASQRDEEELASRHPADAQGAGDLGRDELSLPQQSDQETRTRLQIRRRPVGLEGIPLGQTSSETSSADELPVSSYQEDVRFSSVVSVCLSVTREATSFCAGFPSLFGI